MADKYQGCLSDSDVRLWWFRHQIQLLTQTITFKNLINTFPSVVAFNEVTKHHVAIKILNKRKIKMQGVFEKVKREIKVLRRFNHPHIIKHFEFIDTSSDIFIVLEYAAGGELFDLISQQEKVSKLIIELSSCFVARRVRGEKDLPANNFCHRILSQPQNGAPRSKTRESSAWQWA